MGVITKELLLKLTNEIIGHLPKEAKKAAVDTATNRIIVQEFPKSCEDWTQEQVDLYLTYLEKASTVPYVNEEATLEESVETIMNTTVVSHNLDKAGNIVDKVVNNISEQNKYREDLTCPWCKSKVYDNRNNKKSERSPDFVCSTNDPTICTGHTGKWRKSWWLNSSDIPEEWNI